MKLKSLARKLDKTELPLVPLRELVVFPYMVVPFFVGRENSIKAIEEAMGGTRTVFLACQKNNVDKPNPEDIYTSGTVAKILQMLKLPDGTIRVLAEGQERGIIHRFLRSKDYFHVSVSTIRETKDVSTTAAALMDTIRSSFEKYKKFHKKLPPEAVTSIEKAEFPDKLVDLICAHAPLKIEKKVELLGIDNAVERMEGLAVILQQELEVLTLQNKIQNKVRKRIEKSQKEYFLNEQLKEIKKELGKDGENGDGLAEIEQKIVGKEPPQEVLDKAKREIRRLSKLQPMSPESGVLRTYIDWIADLPWSKRNQDNKDIELAARILDEDHYDLKKPKERILDFIAVRQLKEKIKGPILCLVGPPGTGKTSLGKSIARALGRDFVRISLGGVRDEAEIRGHRKTYVGALPGKIIQSMKKVGTVNPVFLLDEIDKINSDFRGDPASALLEVLDPEQNFSFMDHYLEVPYDLSGVMFITTANSMYSIPYPLRDRMEIIEVPGYTEFEKTQIALDFIIPKQIAENGLSGANIRFQRNAIAAIIQGYTMESGVRNLEREIASVIRKLAREAVKKGFRPSIEEEEAQEASADTSVDGETGDSSQVGVVAGGEIGDRDGTLSEVVQGRGDGKEGDTKDTLENSKTPGNPEPETNVADGDVNKSQPTDPGGIVGSNATQPSAGREALTNVEGQTEPDQNTVVDSPGAEAEKSDSEESVPFSVVVTTRRVEKYLGKRRFLADLVYKDARPGLAHGLAWTEIGGTLLPVEVAIIDGPGDLILTGSLGDVMKESARTALSFIRTHNRLFNLPSDFPREKDIHIHVPEGAIPKDGPSAGITITAALVSAFTGVPVAPGFAMTGEITLTGRLLAIGGVKEKVLAAHRNKLKHVLMPENNRKDIDELPREVKTQLEFIFAESVLDGLLSLFPEPFAARTAHRTA